MLGVGRLSAAKDFATLIRAFAQLRHQRPARLIILGKGKNPKKTAKRQAALVDQARALGVAADLDLPGFVLNPYAYMARAAVLAVSSAHEGFCNVLVEAMACGCPVVSTDCPSGPAEILDYGRFGRLVPVGDDEALAAAIAGTLATPPEPNLLRTRARCFSLDRAVEQCEHLMLGRKSARTAVADTEGDDRRTQLFGMAQRLAVGRQADLKPAPRNGQSHGSDQPGGRSGHRGAIVHAVKTYADQISRRRGAATRR